MLGGPLTAQDLCVAALAAAYHRWQLQLSTQAREEGGGTFAYANGW